jgi:hypothetical protein
VADVAWKAMEFTQHHHLHEIHQHESAHDTKSNSVDEELESLRSENKRLKDLLEHNLKLLQSLSESPCLLNDCPPHVCNYFYKHESLNSPFVQISGTVYLISGHQL